MWLVRISPNSFASHPYQSEVEYLNRGEAEALARKESLRDLTITPERISYVCYRSNFDDFCRVEINFGTTDRGVYRTRLLSMSERLDSEMIDDETILTLAKSDRCLNAVILYRHLHSCTVGEAKIAVDRMIRDQ